MTSENQGQPTGILDAIKQDFVAYAVPAFGLVILGSVLLFFRELPNEQGFYLASALVVFILASTFVASSLIQIQNRHQARKNHENIIATWIVFTVYGTQAFLLLLLIGYLRYRGVL